MPLYEYCCDHCQNDFELLIRGTQQPECPVCHQSAVTKKLSVAASPKSSNTLPVRSAPENCVAPRCCGGGCQED